MKPGFYKKNENKLVYAPNFVEAPSYLLLKESKDTYTYPVEGWHWFETEEEAKTFFDIQPEAPTEDNVPERIKRRLERSH